MVTGHPLLELPGAGPLVTAKLLGEIGDIGRFRSADAFAALAGVAPIPASSGQTSRMQLNRGGNRQLNRALHVIALAQARHHPPRRRTSSANAPKARPTERHSALSSANSCGPSSGYSRKAQPSAELAA